MLINDSKSMTVIELFSESFAVVIINICKVLFFFQIIVCHSRITLKQEENRPCESALAMSYLR